MLTGCDSNDPLGNATSLPPELFLRSPGNVWVGPALRCDPTEPSPGTHAAGATFFPFEPVLLVEKAGIPWQVRSVKTVMIHKGTGTVFGVHDTLPIATPGVLDAHGQLSLREGFNVYVPFNPAMPGAPMIVIPGALPGTELVWRVTADVVDGHGRQVTIGRDFSFNDASGFRDHEIRFCRA